MLTPGLKLNITVDDESFVGEVFYYQEDKALLILSSDR